MPIRRSGRAWRLRRPARSQPPDACGAARVAPSRELAQRERPVDRELGV
jgi:hypothetical protein